MPLTPALDSPRPQRPLSDPGSPMSTSPIRLIAIDDHPLILMGIAAALTQQGAGIEWLGSASSRAQLNALVVSLASPPDIVLYDLHLSDASDPAEGIAWATAMGIKPIVLTSEIRPVPIRAAISAGARGVILKADPVDRMVEVIRTAYAGDFAVSGDLAFVLANDEAMVPRLAPRELQALRLLASGVPRKAIGHQMDPHVEMSTVVTYFNRICKKYQELGREVRSPFEAIHAASTDGYLETPDL